MRDMMNNNEPSYSTWLMVKLERTQNTKHKSGKRSPFSHYSSVHIKQSIMDHKYMDIKT